MNKILLALLFISTSAVADIRFLQYNDFTAIELYSQPCPEASVSKDYPFAASALRVDGAVLSGCYADKGDVVSLIWEGGDITPINADRFVGLK